MQYPSVEGVFSAGWALADFWTLPNIVRFKSKKIWGLDTPALDSVTEPM